MTAPKPEPRRDGDDPLPRCNGLACGAFVFDPFGSHCSIDAETVDAGSSYCIAQLRIDYAELATLRAKAGKEGR